MTMPTLRRGDSWVAHSPAKINLFLELWGRRSDGFHDLETLIAPISLYDTLRFRPLAHPNIRIDGDFQFPRRYRDGAADCSPSEFWSESNLVYRAANLFFRENGLSKGVSIFLTKRIPTQAGLGGASSNAAITLISLARIFETENTRSQMLDWAAQLGSDVPFFMQSSSAICRGRGERVESLNNAAIFPVVVVKPPLGLSTAKVFSKCEVPNRRMNPKSLQNSLIAGDAYNIGKRLRNRLEEFARPLSPWIERLDWEFSRTNSFGHQMSGSGTSYFGIFANTRSAHRAANRLASRLPDNFLFAGHTLAPRSLRI